VATPPSVIIRDTRLWAAFAAAPVFWVVLWWPNRPEPDLLLPFRQPLYFLAVALIYPILEEILFRGGLQPWLNRHPRAAVGRYGISVANILTSVAFAAVHLLRHPPAWAAAMFLPSLVFGYFRDRHNSLMTPILLHVFYNTGYFWLYGVPAGTE